MRTCFVIYLSANFVMLAPNVNWFRLSQQPLNLSFSSFCCYFTLYKTVALINVVYFSKISHHTTFEGHSSKWR